MVHPMFDSCRRLVDFDGEDLKSRIDALGNSGGRDVQLLRYATSLRSSPTRATAPSRTAWKKSRGQTNRIGT